MSHKLALAPNEPWYSKGLSFKCTECGQCCTGAPGHVWVSEEEILEMAQHLGLSAEEFGKHYLRRVDGRYSLIEDPRTFDCCFLKDRKCTIYQARPQQCRTFPWWPQNLASRENWRQAGGDCEGIREGLEKVPYETIKKELEQQKIAESKY